MNALDLDALDRVARLVSNWELRPIAHADASARLVERVNGRDEYRVVSLPAELARVVLALPEIARRLLELEESAREYADDWTAADAAGARDGGGPA
jgi:hypothetical protein